MPATLERVSLKTLKTKTELTPRDIVRAWEDPSFRARLPANLRMLLPEHPAGAVRLAQGGGSRVSEYSNFGSCDNCSSSNCSSSNCSSDNCSSTNCSSDNCSSSNCSGNVCTNWDCNG